MELCGHVEAQHNPGGIDQGGRHHRADASHKVYQRGFKTKAAAEECKERQQKGKEARVMLQHVFFSAASFCFFLVLAWFRALLIKDKTLSTCPGPGNLEYPGNCVNRGGGEAMTHY